jgi:Ca-activated chloride channel family protein
MKTPLTPDQKALFATYNYLADEILKDFCVKNTFALKHLKEFRIICKKAFEQAVRLFSNNEKKSFESFARKHIKKAIEKKMNEISKKNNFDGGIMHTHSRPRNFNTRSSMIFEFFNTIDNSEFSHQEFNEYKSKSENGFIPVKDQPLSTFSVSVDTASYGLIRKQILEGKTPEIDSVRIEELINYFKYNYPQPESGHQLAVNCEAGICPWENKHRIVKVGIKAKEMELGALPPSHLVFLIDVSGSMQGPYRLDLVQSSLKMLTDQLRDTDSISIVTFSNDIQVLLINESGKNKDNIKEVIQELSAYGATNGEYAIQKAYEIAAKHYIDKGNNRVVLCTDGDFNVGLSSESELETLIKSKAKSNIFLTIFGYGMGNFKDKKVKTLALKGHGNYAYIDSLLEAQNAVTNEFCGNMFAMAKDVKVQVEFNPSKVNGYRLIGYETGMLAAEDFNNDKKDAGVMGMGQQVTALYEIIPFDVPMVDPLKYSKTADNMQIKNSDELLTVKVRYKLPEDDTSKKIEMAVNDNMKNEFSSDFRFALAVAMFGQFLSRSEHAGNINLNQVIEMAGNTINDDVSGNRHEFLKLVKLVNMGL